MCLTKLKVVLLILLFIMISVSTYAEITQEQARNIVLNSLGTRIDSVDVYQKFEIVEDSIQLILPDSLIVSPFNYSWAFFIDNYPFSGWMHPCSYYFVNNDNGNYMIIQNDLCPSQNEEFQLFHTIRDTSYSDETEEGIPRNVIYDSTKYAIIINGGVNFASNYLISWNDMSAVYSTLTKYYGYLRENIFIFSTDGSYFNNHRKLDLDKDGTNDINGPENAATETNIQNCLGYLAETLDETNQLFIFVGDHGIRVDNNGNTVSAICLWDIDESGLLEDDELITSEELSEWMEPIDCAEIVVVMGQCYSGGFKTDPINICDEHRVIHTATDYGHQSHGSNFDPSFGFFEFVYYWISAVRGFFPDDEFPYNNLTYQGSSDEIPVSDFLNHPYLSSYYLNIYTTQHDYRVPDENGDGVIQMQEAFNYANDMDLYSPTGYHHTYNNYPEEDPQEYHNIGFRWDNFEWDLLTLSGLTGEALILDPPLISGNFLIGGGDLILGAVGYEQEIEIAENSIITFTPGDYNLCIVEPTTLIVDNNVTFQGLNDGSPNNRIEIYGDVIFGNNVAFTAPEGKLWNGLYLYNKEGSIVMAGATFSHTGIENEADSLTITNSEFKNSTIEQYGNKLFLSYTDFDTSNVYCYYTDSGSKVGDPDDVEINISHCNFENSVNDYPIYICNYDRYDINNNIISDCNQSIYLYECGHPVLCNVSDNVFEENNNIGIQIYHSYADIVGNNVIRENSYGLVAAQNSSISMIGNSNSPYQIVYDNSNEEIVTDQGSYPENLYNNKIYDDSYTTGTPDQYLFRCNLGFYSERCLNAVNNYWGSASFNWNEWDGDSRFSPSDAFDYIPVWDPGQGSKDGNTEAHLLYAEAESLIKQGLYKDAKTLYRSIIDLYTSTDYAMYSMRNLIPMEAVYGKDFLSLKEYYLNDPKCNINDERTKLSQYLANYCMIKLEEFQEAITFFEDIISDPDTELDSVYAVIDAGYTYLLMVNNGKSGYIGKIPELKPKSERDFCAIRDELIAKLFGLVYEEESDEPEIEFTFELKHNYPNPFKGSTKISFSLPASIQKADLKIYNIRGQLVKDFDIDTTPGLRNISWDGCDNFGKRVSSGIYFYKLTADKKGVIKKMIMMR